uniref:Small ribosomal subunit protein uS12m n=1 Tax=Leishmania tarentolae TaxID=5689 RepID=RT12_LEITA|nr:RecName: Full=Small ribosomal subunit protein uS12m; AltName: Full=Ribosomal protein S12, mitochondrial [Leishmania tarentolae]AAA31883.1 ribosomal protein S12 [Leishmania tarentolae]
MRVLFLYGLCVRFLYFCLVLYFSPRLPSSGNRRCLYAICYMFNILWFFCVFCCVCFLNHLLFIVEGGGFIDLPGVKYFSRFFLNA